MPTGILRTLIACVGSLALTTHAAPIAFTTATYDTVAFAVVGAAADANSDSNPPTALPLTSAATVVATNDFATSFALAAPGLLNSLAESDSFAGAIGASAGAQSHFHGTFGGSGVLNLSIVFDNLNSIVGGGVSEGHLFILLTNSLGFLTSTLIPPDLTAPGSYNFRFDAPVGGVNTLDVVLFSSADTFAAGQSAQNFAQVQIGGTIPLPATPLLLLAGSLGMFAVRRRTANRAA